jgi:hypothetical protein
MHKMLIPQLLFPFPGELLLSHDGTPVLYRAAVQSSHSVLCSRELLLSHDDNSRRHFTILIPVQTLFPAHTGKTVNLADSVQRTVTSNTPSPSRRHSWNSAL